MHKRRIMSDTALELVLRRDRTVIVSALVLLLVLAWAYVLWIVVNMDMGGMDMSEFRMIPAGIGIMAPALALWSPFEFFLVFVMWALLD
jgi:predicted metal-binding membrane protein